MAATYFAEIAEDGTVLRVIVASAEFAAALGGEWVETSVDGGARKNYAGPGHKYDVTRDAFIGPKPSPDATLDEPTCRWTDKAAGPLGVALSSQEEI